MENHPSTYTVFQGYRRLATGTLPTVAGVYRAALKSSSTDAVLIFDDHTGRSTDFDLRLSDAQLEANQASDGPPIGLAAPSRNEGTIEAESRIVTGEGDATNEGDKTGEGDSSVAVSSVPSESESSGTAIRQRGRPKLGVVSREVTLLPRHWDWLSGQPGGASVMLRKLVESARLGSTSREARRQAQERAYHFMLALGGDLPGYEEATRALFAHDRAALEKKIADWPEDVRTHVLKLATVM